MAKISIIVPTLNEAKLIGNLLSSLRAQTFQEFEVLVVDGGSADLTAAIAVGFGAKVFVQPDFPEFAARNYAAKLSTAPLLVFSCADTIFPTDLLARVDRHFSTNQDLKAVTGPDVPYDGSFGLRVEYALYNLLRYVLSRLPNNFKRFSTSTNILAVRKATFEAIGGFRQDDVNADGLFGRTVASHFRVLFDNGVRVYISARRAREWGITRFTLHYLYVLENFIPSLARRAWFSSLKMKSLRRHREIHDVEKP